MQFCQAVLVSFLVINSGQFSTGFPLESAVITEYENEIYDGGYHYSFKTSDKTSQQQSGTTFDDDILRVSGSYQFITPDGNLHIVEYTADENGYNPKTRIIPSDNVSAYLDSEIKQPPLESPPRVYASSPIQPKEISSALLGSLQGG